MSNLDKDNCSCPNTGASYTHYYPDFYNNINNITRCIHYYECNLCCINKLKDLLHIDKRHIAEMVMWTLRNHQGCIRVSIEEIEFLKDKEMYGVDKLWEQKYL